MQKLQKLLKKILGNKGPEKNDKINDFIIENLPPITSGTAIEYTEMNGRISVFSEEKEIKANIDLME
ncbi:MAG: hypothetical protein PG981_001548 [Wolbachia endosymbiont of Ctenocephalides orientis wCori]|nr:MAG: hypothetical protein PG981_001548 [Wolbachia endosymbiont of Ctenocephalides orientis wCori]